MNRRGLRAEWPGRQAGGQPPIAGGGCHAHDRALRRGGQSHSLRGSDGGATAVEYALIIGFIAAVIIGTVAALGQAVLGLFNAPLGGF